MEKFYKKNGKIIQDLPKVCCGVVNFDKLNDDELLKYGYQRLNEQEVKEYTKKTFVDNLINFYKKRAESMILNGNDVIYYAFDYQKLKELIDDIMYNYDLDYLINKIRNVTFETMEFNLMVSEFLSELQEFKNEFENNFN